jgi:para-nitrobenzyl esterase
MMQSHRMSDIPVIANFNSGESSSPLQAAKTAADYRQIAARLYGDASAEFLRLYPVSSDAEVAPMAAKVAREASIANASRNCGVMQAQYNKSPVFIDMYDRKHPYTPGVVFADQNPATVGAYHNADIVYWFENQDQFNRFRATRNWTAWDRTLADEMAGALIAFARTGNPTTAVVKWPAWSVQNDAYVRFGDNVTVERFNAQGMQWLAAHPVAGGGRGGRGAPGIVAGRGPRD